MDKLYSPFLKYCIRTIGYVSLLIDVDVAVGFLLIGELLEIFNKIK